jgi:nucleoside triphosphate diphosphatase
VTDPDDIDDPPIGGTLDRALDLVRFLRANCEWDAAQTPESLVRYLLEEANETADAIARNDEHELADELGDLLLNVAFQIVLAEERGAFTAADVTSTLAAKMRRRHPHIYGDGPRAGWDELKRREQGSRAAAAADPAASLLDDVATRLDPLTRADRIQARVAEVGFDWPDASGAFAKVREETDEVAELLGVDDAADGPAGFADPRTADDGARARLQEEIGDLFFAVVNLARLSGVNATVALRQANAKFSSRFRQLESLAATRGIVLEESTLEELDRLWSEVK